MAKAEDHKQFGERLAEIREQTGLSQSALARAVGTSQSAISQIEAGERNPSYDMIRQIATALNLTPTYLLGEDIPELTPEEQVYFRQYRNLPQQAKEALNEYAAYLRFKHKRT